MARECITIDRGKHMLLAAIFLVTIPLRAASPQAAQSELRIRLQSNDGTAVAGALVALLGPNDRVVAEGLSSEIGTRILRAPSGVYRVRARRIGFLPFVSSPVALPRQGELLLDIETARVVLDRIVVNSKSPCKPERSRISVVGNRLGRDRQGPARQPADHRGPFRIRPRAGVPQGGCK